MSRERLFASALAVCLGLVTYGAALVYLPAGFIAGGVLYGALAYLVLSE